VADDHNASSRGLLLHYTFFHEGIEYDMYFEVANLRLGRGGENPLD
jgi:hypothetical protein